MHHLQVALQATLDVSQHIAAHHLYDDYKQNREVYSILAQKGVLPVDLGKKFADATGLRNRLVHQYEEIDSEIVYEMIQNDLGDFDKFVDEISRYLKSLD